MTSEWILETLQSLCSWIYVFIFLVTTSRLNSKSSPSFLDVVELRKRSFAPLGSIVNYKVFGSIFEVLKSKIYGVTFPLHPVNYLLGNLSSCQSPFAFSVSHQAYRNSTAHCQKNDNELEVTSTIVNWMWVSEVNNCIPLMENDGLSASVVSLTPFRQGYTRLL